MKVGTEDTWGAPGEIAPSGHPDPEAPASSPRWHPTRMGWVPLLAAEGLPPIRGMGSKRARLWVHGIF